MLCLDRLLYFLKSTGGEANLNLEDPEQTMRVLNIRGQQMNRFLGGLELLQRQSRIFYNWKRAVARARRENVAAGQQ